MRLIIGSRANAAQHCPDEWDGYAVSDPHTPGRQFARKRAECPCTQLGYFLRPTRLAAQNSFIRSLTAFSLRLTSSVHALRRARVRHPPSALFAGSVILKILPISFGP